MGFRLIISSASAYNYSIFIDDQYYLYGFLSVVLGVHAVHTTRKVEDNFASSSFAFAKDYPAATPGSDWFMTSIHKAMFTSLLPAAQLPFV
ncbi:MAG: hypothetical protein ACRED0_11845 [Gammaproteobacteria bacterium]